MGKLFGTDGLRGIAGEFPLDQATTELLGHVLFYLLTEKGTEPEIIIGRDTRESGPGIFNSLCRGFSSPGGKIDDAGVLSTPALAYLAKTERKYTISITASHNAYRDNGIKIFGPDGYKLTEDAENEIEPYLLGHRPFLRDPAAGGCTRNEDLQEYFRTRYCQHLVREVFAGLDLRGMRVALDCANGALSHLAPQVLRELGAEVLAIHVEPNGRNINENSGALHPEAVLQHLRAEGCDAGFTYDGDGDRCLCADQAATYDGDFILAAAAVYLHDRGRLKKDAVVATTMSNLGLEVFLQERGLHLYRVPVGDKYVVEKLEQDELSLGGEQSGHIIFRNESFIGDGLLTSLEILRMMKDSGKPLSQLCEGFVKYPQILLNIPVRHKPELSGIPEVQERLRKIEGQLGSHGRIVLRYSGTESLARIMIEGPEQEMIRNMAEDLGQILREKLNQL